MSKIFYIGTVLFLLNAAVITSYADIYTYVDKNGVIHYTNRPEDKSKGYRKVISENKTPSRKDYDHIIRRTSSKYNIEPDIIRAVITAESNWNPQAISHKGAIGLMQLMPSTAKDMRVRNPYDPAENIEGGTKYLRNLLNKFDDDLSLALAAYNAGPRRVEESGGIPAFAETRKYVKNVFELYKGKSRSKPVRIYKITYDDGTVLYTNTDSRHP